MYLFVRILIAVALINTSHCPYLCVCWSETILEVLKCNCRLLSIFLFYINNLENRNTLLQQNICQEESNMHFRALWHAIDSFVMIPCRMSFLTTQRRTDTFFLTIRRKYCCSCAACKTKRWWLQYFLDIFWEHPR